MPDTRRERIWAAASPLLGNPDDLDPLLARVHSAPVVVIGGGSYGTHEFFRIRSELTKRLIVEKGFSAVALEADWPDAWRVNQYVRSRGDDTAGRDALSSFERFPQWIWRNTDVLEFVEWLREHNRSPGGAHNPVGFYGLDLYSLRDSMFAMHDYLDGVDPDAAVRARARHARFDRCNGDTQSLAHGASLALTPECERQLLAQLMDLRRAAHARLQLERGTAGDDRVFAAGQDERVVAGAEEYYGAMFGDHATSWNLRERQMTETLEQLMSFLTLNDPEPRVVVWAHNTHVGDARATTQSRDGEVNLGQLVRERYPTALLIGFSSYRGTVTAASDWDESMERKSVLDSLPESYEALFHRVGIPDFLMFTADAGDAVAGPRLQRSIGATYQRDVERQSHYAPVRLASAFDVMVHCDTTRAVVPLDRTPLWDRGDPWLAHSGELQA